MKWFSDIAWKARSRNNQRAQESLGFRVRSQIGALEKKLGPILIKLFPSFIYAHYAYITTASILGSILIYPQRNIPYIDALFLGSGAATQAGLNTVNLNELSLYQQIVIYILCFLTTPIFIHGGILLLRLYWFERYFDDIKQKSKLNHKMRRTATLAAINSQLTAEKTQGFSSGVTTDTTAMPINNMAYDEEIGLEESRSAQDDSSGSIQMLNQEKLSNGHIPAPKRVITRTDTNDENTIQRHHNDVEHISEPSDSDDEDPRAISSTSLEHIQEQPATNGRDIRFAEDLPHPDRRHAEIEPQDMYMSIAMMQNNHKLQHPNSNDDEEGPALVIKGPLEREKERKKKKNHYTTRHHTHRRRPQIKKFKYDQSVDENFEEAEMERPVRRKSMLQFKVPIPPSKMRTKSASSLKSPWRNRKRTTVDDGNEDAITDDDGGDEERSLTNASDEEPPLSKAQTNLAFPSSDQTNGLKYSKRANTIDANPIRRSSILPTSPTFDRVFRSRTRRRRNRKTYSSSSDEDDDDDDDDEEDENDLRRLNSRNLISGNYLSWTPTVARNSTFVALTDEQKEELGGVEYRAVKLLSKLVVIYYLGFHVVAVICYLPFICKMTYYSHSVREDGISPTWWGFFTSASIFNDLGFTLTPDSMFLFYKNAYILLISGFFIVIGNTGFPIFLRFIIWVMFKFAKPLSLFKESLGFLLDHPRRCFTLLFPSIPTWWLFFILVMLNVVDLVLFIILDLNNDSLTSIPVGYRIVDGLFQAFSTRTAGFAVIDLSNLHPSVQVSYMLMMYISVLPLAISIRRTNVYEEQSLGIYDPGEDTDDPEKTTKSFVATHLRNQLSFDLWFIFLGLFIICIADGSKLQKNDINFTVFQVLFEIVSAYGTVGLSLGYPNTATSFCAQFSVVSKLVIIAMMIRGRHRGLPYSLDRAIILPSEKLKQIDKLQERYNNLSRVNTMATSGSRARSNIFDRVKTIRAGLFNVGTVDHANWLDSRMPLDKRSRDQPENITFSLARNNEDSSRAEVASSPNGSDLESIDSGAQNSNSFYGDTNQSISVPARQAIVTRADSF